MAERVPKPRLIPNLVDEYARTSPEYVFARVPKTSNFADGFKDITINTFAKAVDEVAHRILSRLGRSSNFDTIAYIGPSQSSLPLTHRSKTHGQQRILDTISLH